MPNLLAAAARHEIFRCFSIARAGETAALRAGFMAARHPIVVTIGAGLQEDPAHNPHLIKMLAGADFVHGQRSKRADPFIWKVLPSRLYNLAIAAAWNAPPSARSEIPRQSI